MSPFAPAVKNLLVSCSEKTTQLIAASLAWILWYSLHVLKSQKQAKPAVSPLATNWPSGEMATSIGLPALLWPRYDFLWFNLNLSGPIAALVGVIARGGRRPHTCAVGYNFVGTLVQHELAVRVLGAS